MSQRISFKNNRTKIIGVRLSEKEYEMLTELAAECNYTISRYVRLLLLTCLMARKEAADNDNNQADI